MSQKCGRYSAVGTCRLFRLAAAVILSFAPCLPSDCASDLCKWFVVGRLVMLSIVGFDRAVLSMFVTREGHDGGEALPDSG